MVYNPKEREKRLAGFAETIKCVITQIGLLFTPRDKERRVKVMAMFNGEMVEKDEAEDSVFRESGLGMLIEGIGWRWRM